MKVGDSALCQSMRGVRRHIFISEPLAALLRVTVAHSVPEPEPDDGQEAAEHPRTHT